MNSSRRVLRSLIAFGVAMVLGLLSTPAFAAVPNISSARVANPSFGGVANTMMYTVAVRVSGMANDTMHDAQVGYINADSYTTCTGTTGWKYGRTMRFDTTTSRTWTLYNFVPGESYYYRVQVGSSTGMKKTKCGLLTTTAAPTPTLPTNLSYLNLQYDKSGATYDTDYVLFETDDCGGTSMSSATATYYLVAVDPRAEAIVWYMDVSAATGGDNGTGFRYQANATSGLNDRVLMTVDKGSLYEFHFDGTLTASHDFAASGECDGGAGAEGPCIHHDVWKSDMTGRTYVLSTQRSSTDATGTLWEDNCGTDSLFLNDGYKVLNSSWSETSSEYLMNDYGYDPAVDGGPNAATSSKRASSCDAATWSAYFDPAYGSIDWTHANSLTAVRSGTSELLDISLKEWDQVLRVNSATGALVWRLSANASDSDWTLGKASSITGEAAFADQHDVHATSTNTVVLFDNQGDPNGARILEIGLTPSTMTATINKSWAVVDASGDPHVCDLEGSGEGIPGSSNVLAMCNDFHAFVELSDATGATGTAPPVYVSLATDFCAMGGPSDEARIRGWQRAFPMTRVGEF